MSTLGELRPGDAGRIAGLEKGAAHYRAKLLSMGLTPGVEFKVVRSAPMGDPIEIQIRGYRLSLRREEARVVRVEEA